MTTLLFKIICSKLVKKNVCENNKSGLKLFLNCHIILCKILFFWYATTLKCSLAQ